MAKVKRKKEKYVLTMSKDEFDFIAGIMIDLRGEHMFGITRKVGMYYEESGATPVVDFPTRKGMKVVKKLAKALDEAQEFDIDYDYYEWWEEVARVK